MRSGGSLLRFRSGFIFLLSLSIIVIILLGALSFTPALDDTSLELFLDALILFLNQADDLVSLRLKLFRDLLSRGLVLEASIEVESLGAAYTLCHLIVTLECIATLVAEVQGAALLISLAGLMNKGWTLWFSAFKDERFVFLVFRLLRAYMALFLANNAHMLPNHATLTHSELSVSFKQVLWQGIFL